MIVIVGCGGIRGQGQVDAERHRDEAARDADGVGDVLLGRGGATGALLSVLRHDGPPVAAPCGLGARS